MIRPVILLSLTMCLTGALRGFDIPFLLTNGGPGNLSELMSTYMYKKAFGSNQYGYGSALAVFIILESILVISVLNALLKRNKNE
jgi:raffinose/stachyose/melibiose transport system permease protein